MDSIYGWTHILQWYGTDIARAQTPGKWIEAVQHCLDRETPTIAIITDVRFPNEAQWIKENGGYMISVRRLNEDGTQFISTDRDPDHISETALDGYEGWDFQITHRTLNELKTKSIGVFNAINFLREEDNLSVLVDDVDYESIAARREENRSFPE